MKRSILAAIAVILLAGCGSSAPSGPATNGMSSTAPVPSVSALASCDELKVAASHLTTFLHYVALNVGSDNDSSSYVTEMRDTVASLQAAKGVCAGDATAQLAALAAGVQTLASTYQPGTDAATIEKDKAAVLALVPLGEAAFTALGMDPSSWSTAPRFPV